MNYIKKKIDERERFDTRYAVMRWGNFAYFGFLLLSPKKLPKVGL